MRAGTPSYTPVRPSKVNVTMPRHVLEDLGITRLEVAGVPGARDRHGDIHASRSRTDLGRQNARGVGARRDRQSAHFAWAVTQRHPHRVAGRAADVHAVLMNAGGEVEAIRLRKNVALYKHRMRQGALTENPAEQRD